MPVVASQRAAGQLGFDSPAGEGAGSLPHIHLGIIAHAHAEEFQQFPAPVFVNGLGVVFAVVQPVNHGRILRQLQQEFLVVAHALFPEHGHHAGDFVVVVNLGDAGGKDLVPEEGHLLFQWPLGVDHEPEPFGGAHAGQGAGFPGPGVVADQFVTVQCGLRFGVEQFFHRGLVAASGPLLQLLPGGAETGPAHQVGHQGDVLVSHRCPPQNKVFSGAHCSHV